MNNPRYPLGYKVNHFRQARRLLLATSQAAGPLWEFRWGSAAGHLCFVNRILVSGLQVANATAEELQFNVKIARSFTAVDSSNVTSILRTGDNQKLNGDYADSVLSGFVESSAASAASGGSYTQDTDAISNGSYVTIATASTTFDGSDDVIIDLNLVNEDYQLLRFEQNEGFIINLANSKSASQGFIVNLEVAWAECLKP